MNPASKETNKSAPPRSGNVSRALDFSTDVQQTQNASNMSLQICSCGWKSVTTHQGLRIHQGSSGCTPKGVKISEAEKQCPYNISSKERQSFNYGAKRKHKAKEIKAVKINIGLMVPCGPGLQPQRGKTLPLYIDPKATAPDILKHAHRRMRTFHRDMQKGKYVLLYPDRSKVVRLPGSERPFTLAEYKTILGKPYSKITLFICLKRHFKGADHISDSNSETDTGVDPQNKRTPKDKPEDKSGSRQIGILALGQSEAIQPGQIISEDMEQSETNPHNPTDREEITLPNIVANLSLPIDPKRVSKFNISRANVWDGAVRGFKRATYSETCEMRVRFTDDAGVSEEGSNTGGPRREFLTLLMKHLKDRPIFDGPEGHRFLVYHENAVKEDEYYLAGKMIAVSVVHGGPAPHFLSEDLVQYLAGQPSFKSTVNLITDEEMRKALQEIENAAALDALRECILRHRTILETAGCMRRVAAVEEKKEIVAQYLRWYIIERHSSLIDRFKDGLSALQFLTALQQHPALLAPVLCHSEKRLSGFELETLFILDLSPAGSDRRQKESKTLAYWADYLLDCEEGQAAVSVEDVLMFTTGLTSLPPSGLEPLPRIEFLDDSPVPMANTSSNLLKLPLLDSYDVFKSQMDLGIQISPGFGFF